MKKDLIVRAWKDPEFRARLSTEERAALPECPAGRPMTDLEEDCLADIVGGYIGPDQNITDFHPKATPYISVNPYLRLDKVAVFNAAALRYQY